MPLNLPVTTSNIPDWVRRAATAVNALIANTDALTKRVNAPSGSFTFTPQALPTSPGVGQTVFDEADNTVKTWDGTAWRSLY